MVKFWVREAKRGMCRTPDPPQLQLKGGGTMAQPPIFTGSKLKARTHDRIFPRVGLRPWYEVE